MNNTITDDMLVEVQSISELRIGDEVCLKDIKFPFYVVGLFAEPEDLTPKYKSGTIYGDFEDNSGDVLEYNLGIDNICKIVR